MFRDHRFATHFSMPDKKFFESLSGAGKAIGVLTSGGDAQGKPASRGDERDPCARCVCVCVALGVHLRARCL